MKNKEKEILDILEISESSDKSYNLLASDFLTEINYKTRVLNELESSEKVKYLKNEFSYKELIYLSLQDKKPKDNFVYNHQAKYINEALGISKEKMDIIMNKGISIIPEMIKEKQTKSKKIEFLKKNLTYDEFLLNLTCNEIFLRVFLG